MRTIRRSCEPNTPSPSPSGAGLSFPELSRITVRADPAITKPKNWFWEEERSTRWLSRTSSTTTPVANRRSEPFRTVTPEWPSFPTPASQICRRGQRLTSLPSPEIVWPFRSRVMPSAPIRMPLFGQPVRSWLSVVSAVIVSPHSRPVGGSWPTAMDVAVNTAKVAMRESDLSIAPSYEDAVEGETRLATVLAPC